MAANNDLNQKQQEALENTEAKPEGEGEPKNQEMTYKEILKTIESNRQLIELLRSGAQGTREQLEKLRAELAAAGVSVHTDTPAADSTENQIAALEARNLELEEKKRILEGGKQEASLTPNEQSNPSKPEAENKKEPSQPEAAPAKNETLPQINLVEAMQEQEGPSTEIEKALAVIYDALDLDRLIVTAPQERRPEISRIVKEKGITLGGKRDAGLEEAIIENLDNPDLGQSGLLKTRESFIQDGLKRLQGVLASREQQKSPLEHPENKQAEEGPVAP